MLFDWGFSSGSAAETPPASAEDRKLGWEDPLEKVTAAQAGILVWETPWTEKPGPGTVHGVTELNMTE